MSDELENMFYYGETPWHRKGKPVDHALTAEEAIVEGGLDWPVTTMPIYLNNLGKLPGNPGFRAVEKKMAIVRETDGAVFNVLGEDYTPVQNREAFSFFDEVVASKEAKYHTAGSLLGGRWVWILAKLQGKNGTISIRGDAVDKYLLLMNGHDGKLAFKMFFTPIRVVCYNTLTAADAEARRVMRSGLTSGGMLYARHTETVMKRIKNVRESLGISIRYYDTFAEQANQLAKFQLPEAELPKLLVAAFQTTGAIRPENVAGFQDLTEEFSLQRQKQMATIRRLFEGEGKGLDDPNIKGTKWAAYNAVVEYCDFYKKYGGEDPDDSRLRNTLFGSGGAIKKRAWEYLLNSTYFKAHL